MSYRAAFERLRGFIIRTLCLHLRAAYPHVLFVGLPILGGGALLT
jgi:hypothetical protein